MPRPNKQASQPDQLHPSVPKAAPKQQRRLQSLQPHQQLRVHRKRLQLAPQRQQLPHRLSRNRRDQQSLPHEWPERDRRADREQGAARQPGGRAEQASKKQEVAAAAGIRNHSQVERGGDVAGQHQQ